MIRTLSKYDWWPFSCEFNPTRCKYIRCTFTAYEIYSFWGMSFKFYGSLSEQDPFLYTNPDAAYGIRKKEE